MLSNSSRQVQPMPVIGYQSWNSRNLEMKARETKSRSRKKYTIRNPRQQWTAEEHQRFVEAIKLYKRDWARVKEHVGTRTVIQIRSHAQKYFLKLQKQGMASCIPPRRNKVAASSGSTTVHIAAALQGAAATLQNHMRTPPRILGSNAQTMHSSPFSGPNTSTAGRALPLNNQRAASIAMTLKMANSRGEYRSNAIVPAGNNRKRGYESAQVHDLISYVTSREKKQRSGGDRCPTPHHHHHHRHPSQSRVTAASTTSISSMRAMAAVPAQTLTHAIPARQTTTTAAGSGGSGTTSVAETATREQHYHDHHRRWGLGQGKLDSRSFRSTSRSSSSDSVSSSSLPVASPSSAGGPHAAIGYGSKNNYRYSSPALSSSGSSNARHQQFRQQHVVTPVTVVPPTTAASPYIRSIDNNNNNNSMRGTVASAVDSLDVTPDIGRSAMMSNLRNKYSSEENSPPRHAHLCQQQRPYLNEADLHQNGGGGTKKNASSERDGSNNSSRNYNSSTLAVLRSSSRQATMGVVVANNDINDTAAGAAATSALLPPRKLSPQSSPPPQRKRQSRRKKTATKRMLESTLSRGNNQRRSNNDTNGSKSSSYKKHFSPARERLQFEKTTPESFPRQASEEGVAALLMLSQG